MADLAYPATPPPTIGAIQGRAISRFTAVTPLARPSRTQQDPRYIRSTTGAISDVVVLRVNATTEVPFANGRVWLLRAADGYKAWEGWTDAAGAYTATGLEFGVEYVALAIDPTRTHKTTGAGPVLAT